MFIESPKWKAMPDRTKARRTSPVVQVTHRPKAGDISWLPQSPAWGTLHGPMGGQSEVSIEAPRMQRNRQDCSFNSRAVQCIHVHRKFVRATVNNRSVISVHTKPETSKRLDDLASLTRRSKSFLANEAIERYLAEEEAFVASVHRGIADAEAGRILSTDEARARVRFSVSALTRNA
jgi:predicted transcriptional regulator